MVGGNYALYQMSFTESNKVHRWIWTAKAFLQKLSGEFLSERNNTESFI